MFPKVDLSKIAPPEDNISYKQALKRKPKTGWHHITYVNWCPESLKKAKTNITLLTIGEVELLASKTLGLPSGYEMVCHKSTKELLSKLYTEGNNYTFEYIDNLWKDANTINKLVGIGDFPATVNLPQHYWNRVHELDDLWDEYLDKFEDLRKEVFKNESFDRGESPRYNPPTSIIPVIEKMLKLAKERKL